MPYDFGMSHDCPMRNMYQLIRIKCKTQAVLHGLAYGERVSNSKLATIVANHRIENFKGWPGVLKSTESVAKQGYGS